MLKYVKEWTQQFEGTGDPQLGLMSELYDKLRAKSESMPMPPGARACADPRLQL